MRTLLQLIAKLFGKNAINKTIGTRTNVIQLPNNEIKRYIKKDLNIEAASDEAVMKAKKEMEELIAEIPKMNDMERLVFEGNLRRLDNRINPPMAEVVEFGTKEKVTPEGITSLIKEKGQKAPPGTIMGNLESRIKQLEASGKSLEEATEGKGKTIDDILGDVMQSQKTMSKMQDEGLVRAAVRYKMMDDLQKGVLKVPKNVEEVIRGASNEEDVINVFRKNYGEDALEQVDSLVPDFYKMTSPKEAVKKIETDFPNIQPKKIEFPETIDIDKLPPEEFATGGRVGYADGSDYEFIKTLPQTLSEAVDKFGSEAVYGKIISSGGGNEPEYRAPGLDRYYKSMALEDPYDAGRLKDEYLQIQKAGSPEPTTPTPTPVEELETIYTTNVTPSDDLYPNNPFNPTTNSSGLYPNNPFYSPTFGVPTEEDTPKEMSSDISALYDQYMQNLGYQSGGRVGYMGGGSTGLDYLMGVDRKGYAYGSLDEFLESSTLVSPSGKSYDYDFIKSLPGTTRAAVQKFGSEAVYGKEVGGTGNSPGTYVPGKYTQYYNLMEPTSGGDPGLKHEYSDIQEYVLQPENLVRDFGLEGAIKILTPFRKTTSKPVDETYDTNVTPSDDVYPNNPFYPDTTTSSTSSGLYPNNPFYSPTFGVPTEEDTPKEMNSDISTLYDQYMQNLGYQSGGRVGYKAGGVSVDVKSLPNTAEAAINKYGQDMFNVLNLQQYYYPIGATGDADPGYKKPPAIAPVSTVTSPKPELTPVEELQTTYTESVQPKTSKLYPNNPFYSSTFGVPTEEGTPKEMSSDISVLYDQYMKNLGYESGGRVGFNEGTLDPAKEKQIKQMIKMGADVDTISAITGATPEQIQQVQQTSRIKNADGGLSYLQGI